MIINTTFHIDNDIYDDVLTYIRQIYIPQTISGGVLHSPALHRVISENNEGVSLCVQFYFSGHQALQEWYQKEGEIVQQGLITKFGSHVVGFSTLLDELEVL